MFSRPTVLLVGDNPRDLDVFKSLLCKPTILKTVADLPELQTALAEGAGYDVVLCVWSGDRKGTWTDTLLQVLLENPPTRV